MICSGVVQGLWSDDQLVCRETTNHAAVFLALKNESQLMVQADSTPLRQVGASLSSYVIPLVRVLTTNIRGTLRNIRSGVTMLNISLNRLQRTCC